jgi:hypothetical protein
LPAWAARVRCNNNLASVKTYIHSHAGPRGTWQRTKEIDALFTHLLS